MGRGVREETTTLQIVRHARVERVSGRIVRAAKRVTVRAGRVVKASDLQDHVGKVSVRVGRRVVGIVRIVRVAKRVTVRAGRVARVSVRVDRRVEGIVRIVRAVKASGLTVRAAKKVIGQVILVAKRANSRFGDAVKAVVARASEALVVARVIVDHVVMASDLQGRVVKVSVRVGRKVVGIVRIVRAARKVTARVATSIVRGGKIVPNVLLPMLNVGPMKFVAPKVVASTRAAKCHTSVRPKSDGSMRDPSARPSLPSESSKNQFATGRVKQWRPSTHEPWGRLPLHLVNGMDSSRRVA